jgi:hypothetical protein
VIQALIPKKPFTLFLSLRRFVSFTLGLCAMDGFHVQGMAEDELKARSLVEVRQPVSTGCRFDSHRQAFSVGLDQLQESLLVAAEVPLEQDLPLPIRNSDIHGSGVKVYAAVESGMRLVKSHKGLLGEMGRDAPDGES